MGSQKFSRRLILAHARDEAFVPLARVILGNMGYSILSEEDWAGLPPGLQGRAPDLRIVDERRLGEIPEDEDPPVPMIVLSGRQGVTGVDPRILGAVRRPAGLHELFRLIQQALEEVPRSTPRVATNLPARCRQQEREWRGSLLSLSENGCLLRTPEPLNLGSEVSISFELPRAGVIEASAETAYQLVPDLGLVFTDIPAQTREAIAGFVEATLAVV